MSQFGPPPGAPTADEGEQHRRPPTYLPPGGLRGGAGNVAPAPSATPDQAATGMPLLVTSHKPGIIALRPLSLGDVVDGAVKHVRWNPGPVLGASLLVLAAAAVPAILLAAVVGSGVWDSLGTDAVVDRSSLRSLALLCGVGFAAYVLAGALSYSVAEATLGRRLTVGRLWAVTRHRVLPLAGVALLVSGAIALPVVLLVLLLVLALQAGSVVGVLAVGLLGGLVVVAWSGYVVTETCLAGAAVVLERRGVVSAIRRSVSLTDRAFWRTLLRLTVVGLLALVAFWVLQVPLLLVGSLVGDALSLSPSMADVASSASVVVATLLSAAVVVPFAAGAAGLLYVDQRMRLEGLDLVLQRAARGAGGRLG